MLKYTNKKHKYSASTVRVYNKVFITSLIRVILHSSHKGSNTLYLVLLGPQSTYRGRVEIVGVYLPSQLERTPQLCSWWKSERGRACTPPHQAGLNFPSWWNERQKVAIPLSLYSVDIVKGCGRALPTLTRLGWFFRHDGMYAREWQLPLCVLRVLWICVRAP
jgi:hypothetical protein